MTYDSLPHETQSALHIREDVINAIHSKPFMTFEEVYDRLQAADAGWVLTGILSDAVRYSSEKCEQQGFAAGVLHVLRIQLTSEEVDGLEQQLSASAYNIDDTEQRLDDAGDNQSDL